MSIREFSRGQERPEYKAWKNMKSRCYIPGTTQYKDWGGRGIKVCERWLESFENFLADMGERPNANYSLSRKDNDGDYTPDNCMWATSFEQNTNKRTHTNNKLAHKGIRVMGSSFQVRVQRNYKSVCIGTYFTLEEAIAARNAYVATI